MDATAALTRQYRAPSLCLRGREFAWGSRTFIMAILNVTPDSFSGDGLADDPAAVAALARRFEAEGADIIDIGAESSRPGAQPLSTAEECARLLPALRAVRSATSLPISVDTYHAAVAAAALDAGADAVNDIHGLRLDPAMAELAAERGVPVFAMHNQRGRAFHDVVSDVSSGFGETLAIAAEAGIPPGHVVLDPGFGFGWTPEQNLEVVRRLPEVASLGYPILFGPSRKSTIGFVLDLPVDERIEGTAALVALGIAGGADIVRVHDLPEMVRVARVADAAVRGRWRRAP